MLGRLSKQRRESGVHPHDWKLPNISSKRARSRSSDAYPQIPSPSTFKDVAIPYSLNNNSTAPPTFGQYPTPGHVAANLLLVECFHKLRQDVESSCSLSVRLRTRDNQSRSRKSDPNIPAWTAFLDLAIERFRLWVTKIESVIRHAAVFNRFGTGSHLRGAFTENYLPPLDILLIWYTYLQYPTAYERLIASNNFKLLNQICFPWHLVPTCIDQDTLEYTLTHAARTLWTNLVGIQSDLADCIDHDLNSDTVAFMSAPSDILDMALRQSDFFERVAEYQWLRSPSLHGTIQRAMYDYTYQVTYTPTCAVERPQQVPMDQLEARSVRDLDLDLPLQVILSTHRAYHSAWQMFTHLNHLKDEDEIAAPPPPSYDESQSIENAIHYRSENCVHEVSPMPCYCWICERVKDELDQGNDNENRKNIEVPMFLSPLHPVSSPDEADEKRTMTSTSDSSSESETSFSLTTPTLDLNKKQTKAIKNDVAMYRCIESVRIKRLK